MVLALLLHPIVSPHHFQNLFVYTGIYPDIWVNISETFSFPNEIFATPCDMKRIDIDRRTGY